MIKVYCDLCESQLTKAELETCIPDTPDLKVEAHVGSGRVYYNIGDLCESCRSGTHEAFLAAVRERNPNFFE